MRPSCGGAIEDFARDRTTFLITHNLGSLQFADRIVLMNAGRIDAVGTETDLYRESPQYRRLCEIHFQRETEQPDDGAQDEDEPASETEAGPQPGTSATPHMADRMRQNRIPIHRP